jgi:hypothetical protein
MRWDNPQRGSEDPDRQLALGIVALGTVLAIFLRLMPYVPGLGSFFSFWAVGALVLYGAARLRSVLALLPPLVAMLTSDTILWLSKGYPPSWGIYISLLGYALLGFLVVGRSRSLWRIGAAAVLGTLQWFLIVDFANWLSGSVDPSMLPSGTTWAWMAAPPGSPYEVVLRYARTPAGLLTCYSFGLPFALRTLLADLTFTGLFFGLHAWLLQARFGRPGVAGWARKPTAVP